MKTKELLSRDVKLLREFILEKTGFLMKDYLIRQTFTRKSFYNSSSTGDNEVFEFIGDGVIRSIAIKRIVNRYLCLDNNSYVTEHYSFRGSEEQYSKITERIVSNESFAGIIDAWTLKNGGTIVDYLMVGKSDVINHVEQQTKVKADLFEAIIGAIAIQTNYDDEILTGVINKVIPFEGFFLEFNESCYRPVEYSLENAVLTLKELNEHDDTITVNYEISGPDSMGYDINGNPIWCCSLTVTEIDFHSKIYLVYGVSKKETKKFASYLYLTERYQLMNEYGENKIGAMWTVVDGKLERGMKLTKRV